MRLRPEPRGFSTQFSVFVPHVTSYFVRMTLLRIRPHLCVFAGNASFPLYQKRIKSASLASIIVFAAFPHVSPVHTKTLVRANSLRHEETLPHSQLSNRRPGYVYDLNSVSVFETLRFAVDTNTVGPIYISLNLY